ncbi:MULTISPECIES: ABC transporter permease [Phocaeicola]|uniref:ABC transporter permease n=1 Tax=Phocaeicola vulgatus TaxID=821 RepID=A0A415BX55_PHOVU|nr:ABC transporter permease [Phocaeicola vulgatus]RHI96894.1 ABC transporter permease [Phocaeicola vulgatus]
MKTLKYAWRFLMRSKSYTTINLLGLAFSLACSIILMRYIHRELTVDAHCIDREHVYAICTNTEGNRGLSGLKQYNYDTISIDNRFVEAMTTYIPLEKDYVISGTNRIPARCLVTDSVFFQLFHYPIVQGKISLTTPQSALLTEKYARKIFGNENPIGKVLRYSNGKDITVEGIVGEPECKTTINFDIILSSKLSQHWERMNTELYRFLPGTDINAINKTGSVPRYINNPEYDTRTHTFSLISVKDIYWDGSLTDREPAMFLSGNRSHLIILSGVCLLLLLTGILNFINLYLVTLLRRGKEYGLKKVFGVCGRTLFANIWIENTLLVLSALLVSWLIIEIMSAPTEYLFDIHFSYTAFDGWLSASILLLLPVITSIYPYIKYNYTSPILSIRSIGVQSHSKHFRMFFLGAQYIISFLLVVLSLYFNRQLGMLLNTDPGFRTKNIMNVNLVYESKDFSSYTYENMQQRRQRVMQLDNELNACPFIELYEPSYENILTPTFGTNYLNNKGEKVFLNIHYVTPAFFKLYDIKVIEGEIPDINKEDRRTVFVVNKAALKALGYTSINGAGVIEENQKKANTNASLQPIIAVVEDYFEGHLTSGIKPTIYPVGARFSGDLYQIAYTPGKKKEVIDFLRNLEYKVYGSEDFEYTFLEDDIKAMYAQDRQTATIYSIFAGIAIIISSLGLLGISLFDIRQRYREIAIRKVNGASAKDLYRLLFRKYITVLIIAFVIAIPLAYYLINTYTQDFAVRTPVSIDIFIISLLLVIIISLGTLAYQIQRATHINPTQIMKTE